jgi:hypothetical protein
MKTNTKKYHTIALLAVLPLVATAAASAQQWISASTPIGAEVSNRSTVSPSGRMHTIALNRAGAVEGRVTAIDSATREFIGLGQLSVFFMQNGKVAQQTTTSSDGSFVIEGLTEGTYSFVATGDTGFVAYGVQVVAEGAGAERNIMEAGVVSPSLALVKEMLGTRVPAEVAKEVAKSENQFKGRLVGANRVQLEGKKLKGRLTALIGSLASVKGTVVHLYQNGKSIAEIIVDETGEFAIDGLEPGVYEFVANGTAGFAAISFEAVEASSVDTDEMAVSLQDNATDSGYLDVGLAAQYDAGYVSDSVTYGGGDYSYASGTVGMDCVGDSFACGGSCGASCGSCGSCCGGGSGGGLGGRLFGGRGLGRLLLLGAAVAIPLAVSNPGASSPST